MRLTAILTFFSFYFLFSHYTIGQQYWIKNINIIDVETGNILQGHHLEIYNGIIRSITPDGEKIKGDVIDGDSKYIIPGLQDMHVHLDMVGESSLPLFLYHGITGVRDMGGDMKAIAQMKNSDEAPSITSAGAILESPQFFQLIHLLLGEETAKSRVAYGNPENIGHLIDSLVIAGSDFIKVRTIVSQEAFHALSKACEERGISFTGHVDSKIEILSAVKSGLASIEHLDYFPLLDMGDNQMQTLASHISQEKTYLTPTLIASRNYRLKPASEVIDYVQDTLNHYHSDRSYISSKLLENWLIQAKLTAIEGEQDWHKMIPKFTAFGKLLAQEGVPLLAGTDAGAVLVIPGKSLHEELELMVHHMGISPLIALQAATLNPARFLGRSREGRIHQGGLANLVLLDKNPLEDISNTQTISMVIKDGKVYNSQVRDNILTKIAREVELERRDYVNTQLDYLKSSLEKIFGETPQAGQ